MKEEKLKEVIAKLIDSLKNPYNNGEVVIRKLGYIEKSNKKIHYVLTLANEKNDTIVCPITENPHKESITLNTENLISGSLDKNYYINIRAIGTISKSLLVEEIGILRKEKLEEVIEKLIMSLTEEQEEILPVLKALERPIIKKKV